MYKKIITLFISAAMSLLLCAGVSAEESYDGYLYFTVERLTLGQGFAIEPTKVGYYKTDNLQAITKRFLGDKCIITSSSWGDYLSGVVDGGEPEGWTSADIPSPIMEKLKTVAERYTSNELCEFDYSTQSGWQFTVDDVSLSVGASSVIYSEHSSDGTHFTDNSVVRLQFSVYNWGADIGSLDWLTNTNEFVEADVNTFADKSALIKKVADINYANEQSAYGKSYTAAMAVLEDWDATATEIRDAIDSLRKPVKITKSETDAKITLDVETDGEADIYVAFYNADLTLKSAKVYNLSASDSIECTKETENYRIFVWDNMIPLESEIN